MNAKMIRIAAASALLAASGMASAASYCSPTSDGTTATQNLASDGQSTSDVNYSVTGLAPYQNASDCYGVVSGNDNAGIGTIFNGGWTLADKSDSAGSSTAGGVTWEVVANPNTTPDTWTLTGSGSGIPGWFDFAIVLKASTAYVAYLFDNVYFDGSGGGQFTMTIRNNGGHIAGLSHMSVYTRAGECQTNCGGGGGGGNTPEPMSLALVAAALLGARAAARRAS